MRIPTDWKDYTLLDCSGGERLESWAGTLIVRPDPQVIWRQDKPFTHNPQMRYIRSDKGGGFWQGAKFEKVITYKKNKFLIKPTDFKHMGLFPEQAVNWDFISDKVQGKSVLNLFAYTGAMSVVCASGGGKVTHVDSSKGIVSWAKENAALNGITDIRWIVDDCTKFVKRELRRGNKYDVIIMDPPSFGHGNNGEVWKFEDNFYDFLLLCKGLCPKIVVVSTYTTGISHSCIRTCAEKVFGGEVTSDEIGLPIVSGGVLACGSVTYHLA
ncbi:MAG: class I SAM-dependent methyltransferase [Ruminococcus sp.]|jgi:23S rRNA (cytosine1962-C5)-methyltransferase|nr:class I SAM-dependent methyltransferase [Ruminococcus sp.]